MHYTRLTKNRLYILSAHDEMQKSADTAYVFCQEPHFYWLTRLTEPGWLLVVNTYTMQHALLRPRPDEVKALFEGELSDEAVKKATGIDTIIAWSERSSFLASLSTEYPEVFAIKPANDETETVAENPAVGRLWGVLEATFSSVHDCHKELAQLRALKQTDEIAAIQRAVDSTITGFEALKGSLSSSSFEYELEAELSYAFRKSGATGHAYDPIVAADKNACTLHYSTNNDALPENGLVLIDAAASVDGYAADVTRTYAIGTPTDRQRAVHAAVEKAHHKIIKLIKPGLSLRTYLQTVDDIMKDALEEVGLLHDRTDGKTYRHYFPHAIGHGLGIDVHESLGGYGEFKPGMVLTVEPGIYIPEEGIGVRIEDDILVTETGATNLSGALPTSLS